MAQVRDYTMVLGIPSLQTGVFGGIIIGIIAAWLYKRYYRIQLPSWLEFFSGKRFVPDSDLLRRAVCRAGDGGGLAAGSASD